MAGIFRLFALQTAKLGVAGSGAHVFRVMFDIDLRNITTVTKMRRAAETLKVR
jgi:hypothetical protein